MPRPIKATAPSEDSVSLNGVGLCEGKERVVIITRKPTAQAVCWLVFFKSVLELLGLLKLVESRCPGGNGVSRHGHGLETP